MDGARHQLLAGPALPFDQHRKRRGRGPQHRVPHGFHHAALADQIGDQGAGQLRRRDAAQRRRARPARRPWRRGRARWSTSCGISGTPIDQWHHSAPTMRGAVADRPRRFHRVAAIDQRQRARRYRGPAQRDVELRGGRHRAAGVRDGVRLDRDRESRTPRGWPRASRSGASPPAPARWWRPPRPGRCGESRGTPRPSPVRCAARSSTGAICSRSASASRASTGIRIARASSSRRCAIRQRASAQRAGDLIAVGLGQQHAPSRRRFRIHELAASRASASARSTSDAGVISDSSIEPLHAPASPRRSNADATARR